MGVYGFFFGTDVFYYLWEFFRDNGLRNFRRRFFVGGEIYGFYNEIGGVVGL